MIQSKQILENLGYEVEVNKQEYTLTVSGNEQNIINSLLDYEIQFYYESIE